MAPNKSTAQMQPPKPNGMAPASDPTASVEPTVSRKKQKKRQRQQAAKVAAEQSASQSGSEARPLAHLPNGRSSLPSAYGPPTNAVAGDSPPPLDDPSPDYDENYYDKHLPDHSRFYNGEAPGHLLRYPPESMPVGSTKSKKKKRNKANRSETQPDYAEQYYDDHIPNGHVHPAAPPLESSYLPPAAAPHPGKDRIWNTSTAEERERIKEFWLSLEETERRSLVKVEKEAVLKKMKEQQKHSCSCTVCGRKRTAIEEELEVLYDAYYEELEHYANHQQLSLADGSAVMPPPGSYGNLPRLPFRSALTTTDSLPPLPVPSTRMAGTFVEDDMADEEPYSDEAVSDDYYSSDAVHGPASDFFQFGNSLTVDRGILTVADDLLKNDGKKFIEMMEQLAERRMQREEEAQYAATTGMRHPSAPLHNHGPPLDDEEDYDDEVDEDYPSDEDEEYDDAEMETTEEQRMEEGRRMFQIFAARMFEQRVLTAYREKVARERQERLLEELANEETLDAQREAKKAKEAQKKKDKKKQQRAVKEEERLKREAEKAAEDAATREEEERRLEEHRQKKEELRKKREAERKAVEEEKARKEAERQRRIQEAREQQLETERKQRELKEKEKRRKEEAKRKEREEREAREKEKRERELAEKKEKEARVKMEREARDRARKEEAARKDEHFAQAKQALHDVKPMQQPPPSKKTNAPAMPAPPPGLGLAPTSHISPHPQVATPIVPKAPTPMRTRQQSRQSSQPSSPKSIHLSTAHTAGSPIKPGQVQAPALPGLPKGLQPLSLAQPQPASSMSPTAAPPGIFPDLGSGMTGSPDHGTPGVQPQYATMMPGATPRGSNTHDALTYSRQPYSAPPHRGYHHAKPISFPPGITGMRPPMHHNRDSPVNGFNSQGPIGSGTAAPGPIGGPAHSRQASMDNPVTQPIAPPNPIRRPSSNPRKEDRKHVGHRKSMDDVDAGERHLGSSALIDDSDEPLGAKGGHDPWSHMNRGSGRSRFGGSPVFTDGLGSAKMENLRDLRGWGTAATPMSGPHSAAHPPTWPTGPGAGSAGKDVWDSGPRAPLTHPAGNARPSAGPPGAGVIGDIAAGVPGPTPRGLPRPVHLRILVCEACRRLTGAAGPGASSGPGRDAFTPEQIAQQVARLQYGERAPQMQEVLDICDTEGDAQNGGGAFEIRSEVRGGGVLIKYVPDASPAGGVGGVGRGMRRGHGEIGSPVTASAMPFPPRGILGSPGGGILPTIKF